MRPSLLSTILRTSLRTRQSLVHTTRCIPDHRRRRVTSSSPSSSSSWRSLSPHPLVHHHDHHHSSYGRHYFSSSAHENDATRETATDSSSWEDRLPHHFMSLNVWSDQDIPPLLLSSKSTTKNENSTAASHDTTNTSSTSSSTSIDIMTDKATRFLLGLLQDMALGVIPMHSIDRATTERCNRALEHLSTVSSTSTTTTTTGTALRADTILQFMELVSFSTTPSAASSSGATTGMINSTIQKYDMLLPYPTAQTYWSVLKLIAKDPSVPPSRALAIVERMEERYYNPSTFTTTTTTTNSSSTSSRFSGPGDSLELQPTILHYNQVLSSYAISPTLETKAHDAAHLLLKILPTKGAIEPDISSYGHVLRACALSYMTPKSMTLASEIAPMIYQRLQQHRKQEGGEYRLQLTPHIFSLYIKALSYMSQNNNHNVKKNDNTNSKQQQQQQQQQRRRDALIEQAFRDCQEAGMVNKQVLHAFRRAASIPLQDSFLGPNSSDKNIMVLLNTMRKEYKQNATTTTPSSSSS